MLNQSLTICVSTNHAAGEFIIFLGICVVIAAAIAFLHTPNRVIAALLGILVFVAGTAILGTGIKIYREESPTTTTYPIRIVLHEQDVANLVQAFKQRFEDMTLDEKMAKIERAMCRTSIWLGDLNEDGHKLTGQEERSGV